MIVLHISYMDCLDLDLHLVSLDNHLTQHSALGYVVAMHLTSKQPCRNSKITLTSVVFAEDKACFEFKVSAAYYLFATISNNAFR